MVAAAGKELLLKIEDSAGSATYTTIANLTSTALAINNTTVDITNKSSNCFRELLEGGSIKSADISISGVYTESTEQELLLTNAQTNDIYNYQLVYGASDSTVTAAFQVTTYNNTAETEGAQNFDATLISSGTITYA